MIRFFRFTGPLQFGVIFLLLWLFRLPLFFTDAPMLWEDVKNLVIGAKLADGYLIYRDTAETIAPFSALVYWLVALIGGQSVIVSYIISAFILFSQAQFFKWICNNNDILSDKGELPALLYIVVAGTCFDFFSLSPALISVSFILFALNILFKHIKSDSDEGNIFAIGLYLGLAYMSFAPAVIYFLLTYFTLLIFTRIHFRHYLLFLTGFIFPILFSITFFYLLDGNREFLNYYLLQFPVAFNFETGFNWKIISFLVLPTFLFATVGILRAFTFRRFIIYQVISQRIMFIWLIATIVAVTIFFKNVTTAFYLLIPFATFFVCHFFQLMKQKRLSSYLLLIFFVYNFRMVYSYIELPYLNKNLINFNDQVLVESKFANVFKNKKVWVIGNDLSIFQSNQMATCYFNYELSKPIIAHPEYYQNVNHIFHAILIDMPEVIIDNENLMPAIFNRIPYLKNSFYLAEKGVYIKR